MVETATGEHHRVEIKAVDSSDYKTISKKKYFFDWRQEQAYEVYKLAITDTNDILGLVSFEKIPGERRIHIRLLTVSKENKGESKKYENIAGNLITFVSKVALREYAEFACVSLKPKEAIARHYIDKYSMNRTGLTLSVELPEILNLISKYDHD